MRVLIVDDHPMVIAGCRGMLSGQMNIEVIEAHDAREVIWALMYVLFASAISWRLGWPKIPGLPFAPLGIALAVAACILPIWAILLFRREGTEVSPTSPTIQKLVISGPYQFTRNPMYLGLVILTLGIAVWAGTWPMMIVPFAVFATANWVHIPFEEAKMRRQFGASYDDYLSRVRRWV